MAQVLREFCAFNYDSKVIKEAHQANLPIVVSAVMQRADAKNQNGRVYPRSILEREVMNYSKAVQERRALGECDHPSDSVVSLKNASHVVTEIGWRGDEVVGKIELLNTPSGQILRSLMESGVKLGISSRGVGDVIRNESGADVVDESFVLICFDAVSEPSTHGAWIGESKQVNLQEVYRALSPRDRANRIVNEILAN